MLYTKLESSVKTVSFKQIGLQFAGLEMHLLAQDLFFANTLFSWQSLQRKKKNVKVFILTME